MLSFEPHAADIGKSAAGRVQHRGAGMTAQTSEFLIVTSDEVPGRSIAKVLGLVRANSVRARNLARDVQALGRTVVGGRVGVYGELLETSRDEAIAQMVEQARAMGANAIVATRLSTSQVMSGAAEVLAYGTAVQIE